MKFGIAVLVAALALIGTVSAQAPAVGGQATVTQEPLLQLLLKDVSPTVEQRAMIDSIRTRYAPHLRSGTTLDSAAREGVRELAALRSSDIRAVLSSDQQRTWDRNAADIRAVAAPPQPVGAVEALLKDITLTSEQRAKVDSIRDRYRSQYPPINPGTTPDDFTRQRIFALAREESDAIRAALNVDQQKVWDRNVADVRARARASRTP